MRDALGARPARAVARVPLRLSALMVIAGTAVVFLLIVVILTILSTILTSGADIPGWK